MQGIPFDFSLIGLSMVFQSKNVVTYNDQISLYFRILIIFCLYNHNFIILIFIRLLTVYKILKLATPNGLFCTQIFNIILYSVF